MPGSIWFLTRVKAVYLPLRWRHNDNAVVSNHQPHGCLLNRLFRRKSKKTSKLCVTGLCAGNSPGTGEFPAQMASYAENVSIWWRHHATDYLDYGKVGCLVSYEEIRPKSIENEAALQNWTIRKPLFNDITVADLALPQFYGIRI